MTPRELIRATASRFQDAGIPDPENDAALLLSHLTGRSSLELRLDELSEPDHTLLSAYEHLVLKRLQRIPLQYLLGEAPFFCRVFLVDHRVLIPRPETELLCEWALDIIKEMMSPRVLDLCCGSGCIGLTLKAEHSDALVTLSDISQDALDVASLNANRLGLSVSFRKADLLEGFETSSFDLIISNPPYVCTEDCRHLQPELLYEPFLALHGGRDGCDLYRRIIRQACSILPPGGRLLMEIGTGQADLLSQFLSRYEFSDITIRKDYAGIDRFILSIRS